MVIPKKEFLGKKLWEIGLFKDTLLSKIAFKDLQEKGYIRYEDLPLETKDGKEKHFEFISNVYLINSHKVIQCNIRDITERWQMGQAIVEAIKAKEEFTGRISHELRTPLAALKEGISQVVDGLLGRITPNQKKMLNISKANVDRLARLISNVLDLQKFDINQMKLNLEPEDINAVIKDTQDLATALATKRKLFFITHLDKELPKIKFDKDRINQVLSNLVNNAMALTENGGITISTSMGNNYIQVSVADTGPGIKEEDMQKIFDRFVQIKKRPGSTGLGVSICKEIIEAHNGKIWVDSEFGKGSVFYFILPIEERRK
ncbi:MAG: PAS domain-containing sensor histidine kinase [Candidatus Omnitrophica bacterium]|nr:PAS domain-containing sensor histidine kinase [Candidatus Omnitrophota bacterium]